MKMSDYKIEMFIDGTNATNEELFRPDLTFNVKVKHFRQSDGARGFSTTGGHTAIFDKETGMVFSSRCRPDETFSRRKGILACIQKMIQNKCYAAKIVSKQMKDSATAACLQINEHSFTGSGVKVAVTFGPPDYMFLQKSV